MNKDMQISVEQAQMAHRRIWTVTAGALLLIGFYLLALYHEAVAGAIEVWTNSPTYNHAFLILPICFYLVWERRHLLQQLTPEPNLWFALGLPAFGAVWLLADLASVLEGAQLALVAMMQVVILTMIGLRAYRAFLFPALYMFFLVPTGDYLVPPLQSFTADFSVAALRLLAIPVFRDGIFISVPTGHFKVAEACAGLRFLIATIAFGFLFANLVYRSYSRRIIFVVLCFVIPVIANGFRAFGIILVAYLSSNELAVGVDHIVYGWVFFSFVLLLLIWIGLQFREPEEPDSQTPQRPWLPLPRNQHMHKLLGCGVVMMLLAAAAPAFAAYLQQVEPHSKPERLAMPEASAPWQTTEADGSWLPVYPNADRVLRQTYSGPEGDVDFYIAFFRRQTNEAEVIASRNKVADDDVWTESGSRVVTLTLHGAKTPFVMTRLVAGGRQRLVLRNYWIGSHLTVSGLKAKLLQAYGELVTGQRAAAAVLLSTRLDNDPALALQRMVELLNQITPLEELLEKAE